MDHGQDAVARAPARSLPTLVQILILTALVGAGGLAFFLSRARSAHETVPPRPAQAANRTPGAFVPTPAQLATFATQEVLELRFQVEHLTEGKISVDEDRNTNVFSSYAGRVTRLLAKQGDAVKKGQVLFTIEATDMVQAQNDLIAANGAVNKARSQLRLAQIIEKRQRELVDAKAVALKELQTAQNELVTAQNDLRAAEVALEAVRNRARILGKTDEEVTAFLNNGQMSPETPVYAPIDGIVTQRKIGPGQYVAAGSNEPAFVISDLSTVWLVASVRESEAPRISVGQTVRFRVLALPDRTFQSRLTYVGAAIDPASRRVPVRASVDNRVGLLKPEMFASVRIATGDSELSPGVPRAAVIYEADKARVWSMNDDGSVSLRPVTTGLVNGDTVQITSGLRIGEKVITKGSLFIDRLASGEGP